MIVPLLFKETPLGLSQEVFFYRWFCSFPPSTVKISREGRINNGWGENEHSGIKLRAKRRLFLLTLIEWKMLENATNYDDHFQAASVFCWKKWKRQCHRSLGIIKYVFSAELVLKIRGKMRKKYLIAVSFTLSGSSHQFVGDHADPEAPCPAKGYIFREDLPDLPSHSWEESGSSK